MPECLSAYNYWNLESGIPNPAKKNQSLITPIASQYGHLIVMGLLSEVSFSILLQRTHLTSVLGETSVVSGIDDCAAVSAITHSCCGLGAAFVRR